MTLFQKGGIFIHYCSFIYLADKFLETNQNKNMEYFGSVLQQISRCSLSDNVLFEGYLNFRDSSSQSLFITSLTNMIFYTAIIF